MSELYFRDATRSDLPAIVALLADDHLGTERESLDDLTSYEQALDAITSDPRLAQIVCERDGEIAGTMQLSLIPGLSRRGMTAMLIEGVRVRSDIRGGGIGKAMITWAIAYAREHNVGIIELGTHRSRTDAHRFYEKLGFVQSHLGFKMEL